MLVFNPYDSTYPNTLASAHEVKARGVKMIGVSDRPNEIYDHWIRIPSVDDQLFSILEILPIQLLAYHMAVQPQCRPRLPEKPRQVGDRKVTCGRTRDADDYSRSLNVNLDNARWYRWSICRFGEGGQSGSRIQVSEMSTSWCGLARNAIWESCSVSETFFAGKAGITVDCWEEIRGVSPDV